jgi:hypothetical protein
MTTRMSKIEVEAVTAERLRARATARGVTVPQLLADRVPEEEALFRGSAGETPTARSRRAAAGERARWLAEAEASARRLRDDPRSEKEQAFRRSPVRR